MRAVQFRYGTDNLGYLIHGAKCAVAVDGGAVEAIMGYLDQNSLHLKYVTNTHSHVDHTCGNQELLRKTGAELIEVKDLPGIGSILLEGSRIRILHTPGHTADSVCFYFANVLLTGDTLFCGKVGRCFTGDIPGFFQSINLILEFPRQTVIYPGHDYVLEYLETAMTLEPNNNFIVDYRSRYNPDLVRATLGEEIEVDPFVRFNEPGIVSMLMGKGLPVDTEFHRFKSMISLM